MVMISKPQWLMRLSSRWIRNNKLIRDSHLAVPLIVMGKMNELAIDEENDRIKTQINDAKWGPLQKGLKITIVEFLNDSNCWEWTQIYQSSVASAEEGIDIYIKDLYEDTPETLEFAHEQDDVFGEIVYAIDYEDVRAYYYYI
jgi:hypothetical protein